MTSLQTTPALAERGDIHKSCKSIESLLSILNEYCEAAGAVVSLQKKLAKALKEASSSKATAEIASNAMLASASVFESLSEVDAKFSKTLDKEYDFISDDVKKSFKKLTKEEKAHDEKMSVANAKIKQAGQIYEKKAKKRAANANEEHARYINLISTLGPEISQDKYNHAVAISQRHTTMVYSVASCVARLADLEWQKSCECVRRFSPIIGPLGSLRSLCEGGWTGPIPPDLPDTTPGDGSTPQAEANTRLGAIEEVTEHQPVSTDFSSDLSNLPTMNGLDTLASNRQARIPANPIPFPSLTTTSDVLQPPTAPFLDPNTGSVRSLSAFPAPPTHFPFPPARQQQPQLPTFSPRNKSSNSLLEFPSNSPLADSPISVNADLSSRETGHGQQSDTAQSSAPSPADQSYDEQLTTPATSEAKSNQISNKENVAHRPLPHRSQTSLPAESSSQSNLHSPSLRSVDTKPLNLRSHRDIDSPTAREFGVLGSNLPSPTKSRTMDNFKYPRSIERTDTGTSTTGSLVAAMRTRYDNNSGSTSPPPRDLPRLPLHVNNMSARYQGNEFQVSPTSRTNSPPVSRQQSLPLLDVAARQAQDSYTTGSNNSDEERRRRQRQDEFADSSRKQKEQDLRDRELELEARTRELRRERAQFQALRSGGDQRDAGYIRDNIDENGTQNASGRQGLHRQERRVSLRQQLQRPLSKMDLDEVNEQSSSLARVPSTSRGLSPTSRTPESYTQHLVPPPSAYNLHTPPATLQPIHSPKPSKPPSPLLQSEGHLQDSQSSNRSRDDVSRSYTSTSTSSVHAPFCGCEKCSISKYREQPGVQQNSSNGSRRSDKSILGTGWIRRLSMPVSGMKKHQSSNSIGVMNSQSVGSGIADGGSNKAGLFSMDRKKNLSAAVLGVAEDGKLGRPGVAGGAGLGRSYDLAGMTNRSMTNLNPRY